MKKSGILAALSVLILLLGCKSKNQQLAEETLQLVVDYNLPLDTKQKLKICTGGTGPNFNCNDSDAILIEDLTLKYPGRGGDGRFIFEVTGGTSTRIGEFIGIDAADWQTIVDLAKGLNDLTKEQDLRKFFNDNFVTFGFLKDDPNSTDPGHFLDQYDAIFSESSDSIKDVETIGSNMEVVEAERLEDTLNVNYGLSAERARVVAKNISAYQKLSSKRSLTEKERNFFSTELLGVNFKNAQNALTSGNAQDLNDLLEKAAEKNGTSPEQISSILTEIFL